MTEDFVGAIKQFDNRMTVIQCTPSKKKKKNNRNMSRSHSSLSSGDFPKFVLRFSSKENV